MAATIKDVAQRAGVSIATVSHVQNKTRFVSVELTARVNEAIRELAYYPNLLVGSLRGKKTHTVGLVLPSISNETFGLLAETIQKMLFKLGYNLIICNTSYDPAIEWEAYNTLLMKKADAIIAIPTSREPDKLAEIKRRRIPIVLIDRVIPGLTADTVRVDNVKGTHDAIAHLIGLGHTAIGYIDRKIDHSHSLEQKAGYRKALEEHGIAFEKENLVRADGFDYHSGLVAVKVLLAHRPRLTAVFAYYDITAMGAMRGILDLGLRIPEDVSVVGYDGMPFTIASSPRLTTIEFPVHKIAKSTCDLLMRRLEETDGMDGPETDIVITPRLTVRDSTARLKEKGDRT